MRALMLIPLLMLLVGAGGWILCIAAGLPQHPRAMLVAAGIMLVASLLGAIVLIKVQSRTQPDIAQGALIGMSLQMLVALALSGAVYIAGMPLDTPFAVWLLVFYSVTLAALAAEFVRVLNSAPVRPLGTLTK